MVLTNAWHPLQTGGFLPNLHTAPSCRGPAALIRSERLGRGQRDQGAKLLGLGAPDLGNGVETGHPVEERAVSALMSLWTLDLYHFSLGAAGSDCAFGSRIRAATPCMAGRTRSGCHDRAMSISSFSTPVHRSGVRLAVMAAVGLAAALAVGDLGSWAYAPALGWAAASLTYLIWVWSVIGRLDATGTAAHARARGEDPGRVVSELLVLAATVGSFGGVALILLEAGSAQGGLKAAIIALALGSVTLSWLLVQTLFTLRYAIVYYRENDGVDFNEKKPPRYADFAYLAFTIGMTFQVSDTNLTTDAVRYTVLRHALLSYVLGAMVLATVINLVSGLVH